MIPEKVIMHGREVTLHPITEGQIFRVQEPPPHISAGCCYDCNYQAHMVVEEQDGNKWLFCGDCNIGG